MSWDADIDELKRRRALAKQQGGADAVARQHDKGRLTIRERIDGLLDAGSFNEVGEGAGVPEDRTDALGCTVLQLAARYDGLDTPVYAGD